MIPPRNAGGPPPPPPVPVESLIEAGKLSPAEAAMAEALKAVTVEDLQPEIPIVNEAPRNREKANHMTLEQAILNVQNAEQFLRKFHGIELKWRIGPTDANTMRK